MNVQFKIKIAAVLIIACMWTWIAYLFWTRDEIQQGILQREQQHWNQRNTP